MPEPFRHLHQYSAGPPKNCKEGVENISPGEAAGMGKRDAQRGDSGFFLPSIAGLERGEVLPATKTVGNPDRPTLQGNSVFAVGEP